VADAPPVDDRDVVEALRALGLEAAAVTPIGAAPPWREGRATYRVEVVDGRTFKARRLPGRADKAAQAAALASAVRQPAIPEPVGLRGSVVVDRWVEGTPLSQRRLAMGDVEAAADLLVGLHLVQEAAGVRLPRRRRTAPLADETATRLSGLQAAGVLDAADAARLRRLLERLPPHGLQGVIHGDLCATNLVVTSDGLVSVDNEGLRIDFFAYDLARTWCRWPMSARLWERFRTRYGDGFPAAASPDADGAWRAVAAVKSASLWRATPGPGQDAALATLRRLLATTS
jgi:aminoglycoside phosphotransferase (APT) family kinase protein